MTPQENLNEDLQIEDTLEFANYELEAEETSAPIVAIATASIWSWSGRGGFAGGFPKTRGPDPAPSDTIDSWNPSAPHPYSA